MISSSFLRSLLGASLSLVAFGAQPDRHQAQAQLLDQAETPCFNCFFGPSTHHFCMAADNQVLIGYLRTPVINWQDSKRNALTNFHRSWTDWTPPAETVPISYDDKYIWLSRPEKPADLGFWMHMKAFASWASRGDSKQVRLKRYASGDIFTHNDRCRAAGSGR